MSDTGTDNDGVTVKLSKPIQFGTQVIEEMTFQPITGRHMRRVKTPARQELALVMELACLTSGQTQEIMDMVQGPDLVEIMAVVGNFFGGSPLTGDMS